METAVQPVRRQGPPSGATTAQPLFFRTAEHEAMSGEPARKAWAGAVRPAPELSSATGRGHLQIRTIVQLVLSAGQDVTRTSGHAVTLSRLRELLREPETDDYGIARPAAYSYDLAVALLEGAARLTRLPMGRGSVCTDSEGRVRVTWKSPERELRLVVASSPSDECYVYHEAGDEYGVKPVRSAEELANWLDWLAGQS